MLITSASALQYQTQQTSTKMPLRPRLCTSPLRCNHADLVNCQDLFPSAIIPAESRQIPAISYQKCLLHSPGTGRWRRWRCPARFPLGKFSQRLYVGGQAMICCSCVWARPWDGKISRDKDETTGGNGGGQLSISHELFVIIPFMVKKTQGRTAHDT